MTSTITPKVSSLAVYAKNGNLPRNFINRKEEVGYLTLVESATERILRRTSERQEHTLLNTAGMSV
jgi:hypothetical protein